MEVSKKIIPYVRILGFTQKGKDLISEIAIVNPKNKVITSVKKFLNESNNRNLIQMIDKDIFATNIYTLGYEYNSKANLDYTQQMVIME